MDPIEDFTDYGNGPDKDEAVRRSTSVSIVASLVVLIANALHDLMVDATLSVEAGHDIAVEARRRVMQRHRVLNVMTHVDPWQRPDRDHAAVVPMTTG